MVVIWSGNHHTIHPTLHRLKHHPVVVKGTRSRIVQRSFGSSFRIDIADRDHFRTLSRSAQNPATLTTAANKSHTELTTWVLRGGGISDCLSYCQTGKRGGGAAQNISS